MASAQFLAYIYIHLISTGEHGPGALWKTPSPMGRPPHLFLVFGGCFINKMALGGHKGPRVAHKGPREARKGPRGPTRAQGASKGPAHKGPGAATRAQGAHKGPGRPTRAWPTRARKGPEWALKGVAHKGPGGPQGPRRPTRARPTRAQGGPQGPTACAERALDPSMYIYIYMYI